MLLDKSVLYLVGAVEQGEDISLLHGDLTWALLLVVVEGQYQLLTGLIIGGRHLLLFGWERRCANLLRKPWSTISSLTL